MLIRHYKSVSLIIPCAIALVCCPGMASHANDNHERGVVTITELETVPNADFQDTPPSVMGDVWTFEVERGGNVIIQVNTRDDNGDLTSNLDPIAFLYDESGATFLDAADDTTGCAREPVCGYACPQMGPIFLDEGKYKIVVRDYNQASATGKQCNGGAYTLSVTGPVEDLKAVRDDKNVIFDPPLTKEALEVLMNQTESEEKRSSLVEEMTVIDEIK